ncbi:MAG TPA: small multi-drug export protein [Candidatus Omnitrophota bacterium]|nr:small multi-drug export protein [Candidatus Omnitrophota bacterium]
MDLRLIYAVILSILPVSELRGGLIYALAAGLNPWISFAACTIANILIIFFIFFFLDKIHAKLLKIAFYRNSFEFYLEKIQKKTDKFEKHYSILGFFALTIFTAIPLPVIGGAWSWALISWILDLDRKKSILAISLGVLIAGLLVLFGTLGFFNLFK